MKKEIRIGLIGLSDAAVDNHILPLSEIENVILVGGYDTDAKSFDNVKQRTGIELENFEDITDLVRASDALIICSPVSMHCNQLVGCLLHRKHVLCQAPLCYATEVESMVSAIRQSQANLLISTYYPRRFDPLYEWLKRHLSILTAKYGDVLSVNLDFSYPVMRRSKSGNLIGKFYDQDADYLNYLLPQKASAERLKPYRIFNSADRYEVSGIRADGISFRFSGTCRLSNHETPFENIEIRFQKATLYLFCGKSADKAMVMEHKSAEMVPLTLNTEKYSPQAIAMKINQNFVDAIRGEAENYVSREELLANYVASRQAADGNN